MKWLLNDAGPRPYYFLASKKNLYSVVSFDGFTDEQIAAIYNEANYLGDQWIDNKVIKFERQYNRDGIALPSGSYSYRPDIYPSVERLEQRIYRHHEAYAPIVNISNVKEDMITFIQSKDIYTEMDVPSSWPSRKW